MIQYQRKIFAMKLLKSLIFIIAILSGTYLSVAQQPKRNSILFFEIDDWVEVYVDGEMVFKKEAFEGQLGEAAGLDLNPFLKNKIDPIVEVRLINAICHTCESGNGWLIEFEVIADGESVDYILEVGDSLGGQVVFSMEFEWEYL